MAGAHKIRKHRKMERVMPVLQQLEDKNDYLPQVVSFGPYHHGEAKLAFVEAFKPTAVELFTLGGRENKEFYYDRIVAIIDDLRSCYVQASMANTVYTDAYLAEMLLRDASLLIVMMEVGGSDPEKDKLVQIKIKEMKHNLGILNFVAMVRDMVLLDNQIPLRVIRVLVDARDGDGCGDELITRSLIMQCFGEHVKEYSQPKFSESPHLLGVIRRLHISRNGKPKDQEAKTAPTTNCCIFVCRCSSLLEIETRCMDLENGLGLRKLLGCKSAAAAAADNDSLRRFVPVYRAATDLKAKGIYFKPSPTESLDDVTFKYHFLYARLRIPVFTVDQDTRVLYKNMIAYELSPNSPAKCKIASFINLIKSLIEKAEDVKELREKKILLNKLGSDQEVLDILKDIKTHGADVGDIYEKVRNKIGAHCESKMKTWNAELLHTNFKSPWTMFAFLAAVVLLGVTVAQLYYAVYPN